MTSLCSEHCGSEHCGSERRGSERRGSCRGAGGIDCLEQRPDLKHFPEIFS